MNSQNPSPSRINSSKIMIKNILICLTLAHLCFIPIWEQVTGGTPRFFFLDTSIGNIIIAPLLAVTFLFSAIGAFALYIRKRGRGRLGGTIWVLLILASIFSLCRIFLFSLLVRNMHLADDGSNKIRILFIIIMLIFPLIVLFFVGLNRWIFVSRKILFAMSPILALLWVQSTCHAIEKFAPAAQHIKAVNDSHQTIWILLFDEFDGKTILDDPVAQAQMPELAVWKSFSINSINAYPPTGATLFSIPALIHGKQLRRAGADLDYEFSQRAVTEAGEKTSWDWSDSLFNDVKREGGTTAIVGWAFPYSPFYAKSADIIYWVPTKAQYSDFFQKSDFIHLIFTIPIETYLGPLLYATSNAETRSIAHKLELDQINQNLMKVINNPLPDLVWVHFPLPHFPAVSGKRGTYLENLKIVDNELALFRKALLAKGRFEEATTIVLGDHWLRKDIKNGPFFIHGLEHRWDTKDHRTPFLVKLPSQSIAATYNGSFNTIILRNLISALRRGEIKSPIELTAWIDTHTPYAEYQGTLLSP